jgi:hypothetical protein
MTIHQLEVACGAVPDRGLGSAGQRSIPFSRSRKPAGKVHRCYPELKMSVMKKMETVQVHSRAPARRSARLVVLTVFFAHIYAQFGGQPSTERSRGAPPHDSGPAVTQK